MELKHCDENLQHALPMFKISYIETVTSKRSILY